MRTVVIQDNRCLGGALAEEIQYAREREVESGIGMRTMRVYLCYDVHTNDIIKDQRSVAYSAPRNTVCIENVSLMPCCYVSVLSLTTAHRYGEEDRE